MLERRALAVTTALLFVLVGALPTVPAQDGKEPSTLSRPAGEILPGQGSRLELTLELALRLGLENNLTLQVEDLSAQASLFAAQGGWGAFDWTLGASAGITDTEFESDSIFGGSRTNTQSLGVDLTRPTTTGGTFRAGFDTANTDTDTDSTFSAFQTSTTDIVSLSYVQPLLRGAWRQYATASQTIADIAWRRTLERQRQVRHRLLLDVSNAYWDLVAASEEAEVARSSLALARKQQDQDQRRLAAGVGRQIDVLSAETQVATREQVLLAAEVRIRQRADVLRRLIFPSADPAQWETALIPTTPLPEEVTSDGAPVWDGALHTALAHRPELRQQELLIDQLEIEHDARRSESRPRLDLSLSASSKGLSGEASEAFEEAARYDFPTYQALLSFSVPLGNRSARGAERAAWATLRAANLSFDDIGAQVASEVREALRQIVYQSQAVRAAQKSLDLALRQLEAEEKRYQEGISTNFQVLSFQQDLTQALFSERLSRANYAKALAALASSQGVIGEDLP